MFLLVNFSLYHLCSWGAPLQMLLYVGVINLVVCHTLGLRAARVRAALAKAQELAENSYSATVSTVSEKTRRGSDCGVVEGASLSAEFAVATLDTSAAPDAASSAALALVDGKPVPGT